MGTRSITRIFDGSGDQITAIYRQMDGYPEGMGLDLAHYLRDITIVNGMSLNETRKIANGIHCLAALIVCHFKEGQPGGIYLYPPRYGWFAWQEYEYHIKFDGVEVTMACYEAKAVADYELFDEKHLKLLFEGTPQEYCDWLDSIEEEVA